MVLRCGTPYGCSEHGNNDDDEEEDERRSAEREREEETREGRPRRPSWGRTHTLPAFGSEHHYVEDPHDTNPSPPLIHHEERSPPIRNPLFRFFGRSSSEPPDLAPIPPQTATARSSEESTPLTTSSSDDSTNPEQRGPHSATSGSGTLTSSLSSRSWSEPLHAGLSREARLRIKAQARDKPVPKFGWRYWLKTYWASMSLLVSVRAAIWGVAIVFMHYCGMWAMEIPEGRIVWNWGGVVMSYVVAFTVCFVGCVAMVHMEVHFGRQVAFSTIASIGVCSMHYTGTFSSDTYAYFCSSMMSSRYGRSDVLHQSAPFYRRRIPRLPPFRNSGHRGLRLRHIERGPCSQRHHFPEPHGRSYPHQAAILAHHGREGGR